MQQLLALGSRLRDALKYAHDLLQLAREFLIAGTAATD
jgi:hypothetical protein